MLLKMKEITHYYGKHKALDHFSAELTNGVYGLLGPNGAGKTTLINILVTLLCPTEGEVLLNNCNILSSPVKYLDKIGYLPQMPTFYKEFRALEFLLYMATVKGLPNRIRKERAESLLRMVNLWEERNQKIGSFSGGMKQRLGIAQALLNDPDILILDEPTAGLDPKERIRFRKLISKISTGKIVILATHIVPDIEYIAHNVILLKNGIKIRQESPSVLMNEIKNKVWNVQCRQEDAEQIANEYPVSNAVYEDDTVNLRVVSETKPTPDSILVPPNLEDVYLYYFSEVYAD